MDDLRTSALALLSACALSACGGGGSAPAPSPTPGPSDSVRAQAAAETAQKSGTECGAIHPFYWEIGDGAGAKASGAISALHVDDVTRTTVMQIASASKWLYGAYVAQKRAGTLTNGDVQALTFRSGYTDFSSCQRTDTVGSCATSGTNGTLHPENVGKFFYSGGHMQVHANALGLGALDNAALASEIRTTLGLGPVLTYTQPQLAGGVATDAATYAAFLQKLLRKELQMASLLGSDATCTNPRSCPTAVSTPAPGFDWGYSLGHWVESDPVSGDGSFSSAGAFGFYPWIDATKSYYGVIARVDLGSAGQESAMCGALIRKAWLTGTVQ